MGSLGEERTLIHAHSSKTEQEMDWKHPGRRLTTKNGYRKKMERKLCLKISEGPSRPRGKSSGDPWLGTADLSSPEVTSGSVVNPGAVWSVALHIIKPSSIGYLCSVEARESCTQI